ncbi:radical SAM family heme chaperone HemW [Pseudoneobacillus rhizosphaerae]|uniref:Heme chaperone HemW n=1 Tax=Pseudoneobacillus rhizosphaerae TaxID=2880968 RepID=A0A9C7LA63_9BACI|nr:radical SAM family heme chaperone HemW [Pseudoneobacillus rhizosphaerae]CAG9608102.1 Heme chaperone HemW [Pseudoneobacillus rhizosphaerae]
MIHAAYIHIPFCQHICHYCDFNKMFLKDQPVDGYLALLEKEMELTLKTLPTNHLETIFVGGGTPTALSATQLADLCESVNRQLPFNDKTEFTFEANPGDLSLEKFEILKAAGVNRISFGVQTFNETLLKKIGRTHRPRDVYQSIEWAKKVGFENISIDLIYGLPEQTLKDFEETLEIAFSLNIPHYSGYSLIIEPKTVFYNQMRKGKLPIVGEDLEAKMYGMLMNQMATHGFEQYEISNFSKAGFESKHNLTYWNNDLYYGFGAGAHSYVNGYRKANYGPLKKYMEPLEREELPIMEEHLVTREEKMEEEMFLGLRKTKGVSIGNFEKRYGTSPLEYFSKAIQEVKERNLIDIADNHIFLTRKGRFLGNEVFQSFIGI